MIEEYTELNVFGWFLTNLDHVIEVIQVMALSKEKEAKNYAYNIHRDPDYANVYIKFNSVEANFENYDIFMRVSDVSYTVYILEDILKKLKEANEVAIGA